MQQAHNCDDGPGEASVNFEDLRAAPRFTLLIRSAKLICDRREYLCIVRDVSETGVRLRMFHPMPSDGPVTLELATGDSFVIEMVWERDGHAGFRFTDAIDIHNFIKETGAYPRRPVRLRLQFPATINTLSGSSPVAVRDFSGQGARIETEEKLAIGQKVKLQAKGLPDLIANVCWRSRPAYGLVFQQSFTFEQLARLAAELQSAHAAAQDESSGEALYA